MLVGKTPFEAKNANEVYSNILERRFKFPKYIDKDARDLIDQLMRINPYERIGF